MKIVVLCVVLLPILHTEGRAGERRPCTSEELCPNESDWNPIDKDEQCRMIEREGESQPEYKPVEFVCSLKFLSCETGIKEADLKIVNREHCDNQPPGYNGGGAYGYFPETKGYSWDEVKQLYDENDWQSGWY